MALCIPTLVGPVSEFTKSIRVQGALPGATIIVNSVGGNARVVAKGMASGGDDRVPLVSGPLKVDDILVVSQELSGDNSGTTPESMGMPVQKIPTALGHIGFVSHLYKCGEYVWLSGGFPGATIEVRDSTDTVIGSGESNEGDVRMTLSSALSGTVTAHQLIPSVTGPDHYGYPDQINMRPLPSPTIQNPLVECQTRILINAVYDGAKVTIQKNDGTEQWAGFDRSSLWFPLSTPLKVSDELKVKQNMHVQCEQFSDFSSSYSVQRAADVTPPIVQTPICAGSKLVRVSNLVPGSIVTLTINGKMYKGMPPGSVYDFMVDKLDAGTVKATMELCGVNKDSATAQIDPTGNQQPVELLDPLYSCARAVSITNITPGTALQVWKTDGSQKVAISSIYHIFSQEVTISVTPYLIEGDKIWVKQWSCSDVAISSNIGVVIAHPTDSNPSIIEPVHTNTSSIDVKSAVAGALVEAYILRSQTTAWVFCGSAIGKPAITTLYLNTVLGEGDQLKVRQLFCSADERLSKFTNPPVTVVAYTSTKTATKSGTFTRRNCPSGQIGSSVSYSQSATATAKSIYSQADADQKAQAAAESEAQNAVNSGGQAYANSTGTCSIPNPVLDSFDVATLTLKGKNFLPSITVYVQVSVAGTILVPDGSGNVSSYSDFRTGSATFTSDSSGNISVYVNPRTVIPPIPTDSGPLYGFVSGEQISFVAADSRNLWSNKLTLTVS